MIILPACESDLPQILALQKAAFESEARLVENWNIPPLTQTLEELVAEDLKTILAAGVRAAMEACLHGGSEEKE